MIFHISIVRKYRDCQIRLILPELCYPKAIHRENTKLLFTQSNIVRQSEVVFSSQMDIRVI